MICEAEALNPVFFELGSIQIHWYGVIIATGLFIVLYLATKEAERLKLHKDLIIELIVFAAPIAIILARIYYVIFQWDRYATGPFWKIFAIWEGGIAIHGRSEERRVGKEGRSGRWRWSWMERRNR